MNAARTHLIQSTLLTYRDDIVYVGNYDTNSAASQPGRKKNSQKIKFLGGIVPGHQGPTRGISMTLALGCPGQKTLWAPFSVILDTEWPGRPAFWVGDVPGSEKLYARELWADLLCSLSKSDPAFVLIIHTQDAFNHDKGQKSAISGRRLRWIVQIFQILQWNSFMPLKDHPHPQ